MTVSVYSSPGGTLLYSGTTDATGTVNTGLSAGTYRVTVTGMSARFAAYSNTGPYSTGTDHITLSAATGYGCMGSICLIPAPTTLYYTGPAGPLTLHGSGASYEDAAFTVEFFPTTVSGVPNMALSYLSTGTTYYTTSYTCPPGLTASFSDGSTVTE